MKGAVLALLIVAPDPWLRLEDCPGLDEQALRELTALELSRPISARTATIRCEPEVFVVTVHAEDGRAPVQRSLRTAAVGDAPERYLAVELAELVESSMDPASAPESPASPSSANAPARASDPAEEASAAPMWPSGWVTVGPRFELGGQPGLPAGGGGVVVGGRIWRWLSLRAELMGLGGARRIGADLVRLGFVGGAGAALATFDVGAVMLEIGAGARVGERWIRGIPGRSDVLGGRHRGLTWSPLVSFGVVGPIGQRGVIATHLDAGWTLREIRGFSGDDLVFTSGGPWFGVSLGGGIRLGR
ncbi:MAG: hypothetical protein AAGF11_00840 [Myxococcota bacterium]